MASFNKVILIGNLTADPELKQTQSGLSVCSFSIAVNRRFKAEGQTDCDFITVVAWKQNAEFVCKYFKKGHPILVCGQLQVRSWTDNQGQKRYATEVVADEVSFVASAPKEENNVASVPDPRQWGNCQTVTQNKIDYGASAQFEEIPNDESLPF